MYSTIPELKFADAVLGKCVTSTAQLNNWTDVGHVVTLRCNNPSGERIKSLEGIEHLGELNDVNFAFNSIDDISPLTRLPRLAVVDLSHNRITALPEFEFGGNLRRLELNYNLVESVDWLTPQRFQGLVSLSLAHNHIGDISAIRVLGRIEELNLRNNRIRDLAPVMTLGNLKMLDVGSNFIEDISDIGDLSELRRLFIDRNRISNPAGIESLHLLEELDLSKNPLQSTSNLSKLERLQRLNLNQTGINTLDNVLALGDLELLRVVGNPEIGCDSIGKAIAEYGAAALRFDQNCDPGQAD